MQRVLAAAAGVGACALFYFARSSFISSSSSSASSSSPPSASSSSSVCICAATWEFSLAGVMRARETLAQDGSRLLEALEKGINVIELDNSAQYFVGYGGLPNSEGHVECDAAIMDGAGNIGCVGALQNIRCPISVARAVLEHSPHNVIVGAGALAFAREMGFPEDPDRLLTDSTIAQWKEWVSLQKRSQNSTTSTNLVKSTRQPQDLMSIPASTNSSRGTGDSPDAKTLEAVPRDHDTIGMVVCNPQTGDVAVGVSTSGWAFKHPGRLGDVPLVGCGFYAVNGIGAAVATGDGEEIMKSCLSFLVVEFMRVGHAAQRACDLAIERLLVQCKKRDVVCGLVALSAKGDKGAATTVHTGNMVDRRQTFPYAVCYLEQGKTNVTLEHAQHQ